MAIIIFLLMRSGMVSVVEYSPYSVKPLVHPTASRLAGEIFIDIEFTSSITDLKFIQFQNFYSACVTIKQGKPTMEKGATIYEWSTVLDFTMIMEDPHFEGDATNWCLIDTGNVSRQPPHVLFLFICNYAR